MDENDPSLRLARANSEYAASGGYRVPGESRQEDPKVLDGRPDPDALAYEPKPEPPVKDGLIN